MLAGEGETGKPFDIERIICEGSEKPSLSLGSRLGPQLAAERGPRTGETFVDTRSRVQSDDSATARVVQKQDMKRS